MHKHLEYNVVCFVRRHQTAECDNGRPINNMSPRLNKQIIAWNHSKPVPRYLYNYIIYIYPLTNNCSIETYVQSYWRSCLLLTRRLSSTHLHNQLWINNLLSPSGQIISLPKQLEFQTFVPIFFVVKWPFCQDRPCPSLFFGSIIHRKNFLWMYQILSYAYPWQSPCGSLCVDP